MRVQLAYTLGNKKKSLNQIQWGLTLEIYVCFIRDNKTGTDFTTVMRGFPGQHAQVKTDLTRKYPTPNNTVLTVLTLGEMEATLTDIRRWCGIAASTAKTTEGSNLKSA